MAYVRWLMSERTEGDWVVRQYEVETPQNYLECPYDVVFPKLVELELHISRECAAYFSKVPYSLAEAIWHGGLYPDDYTPFGVFCWNYGVLYYPREPVVEAITDLDHWRQGPIVLRVTLAASAEGQ